MLACHFCRDIDLVILLLHTILIATNTHCEKYTISSASRAAFVARATVAWRLTGFLPNNSGALDYHNTVKVEIFGTQWDLRQFSRLAKADLHSVNTKSSGQKYHRVCRVIYMYNMYCACTSVHSTPASHVPVSQNWNKAGVGGVDCHVAKAAVHCVLTGMSGCSKVFTQPNLSYPLLSFPRCSWK